jgi:hypothetical protein
MAMRRHEVFREVLGQLLRQTKSKVLLNWFHIIYIWRDSHSQDVLRPRLERIETKNGAPWYKSSANDGVRTRRMRIVLLVHQLESRAVGHGRGSADQGDLLGPSCITEQLAGDDGQEERPWLMNHGKEHDERL